MVKFSVKQFLNSGVIFALSPDQLVVGWGEQYWHAEPPKEARQAFYFPDFFLTDPKPWMLPQFSTTLSVAEFVNFFEVAPAPSHVLWHVPQREDLQSTFAKLQLLFKNKTLEKAVPYLFMKSAASINASQLAHSLRHAASYAKRYALRLYGFWNSNAGLLGATPETLFTWESSTNQLETMACAGTFRNIPSTVDAKTSHEHQCVARGIVDSLHPFGSPQVAATEVKCYGSLSHVVTPIHMQLDCAFSFQDVTKALQRQCRRW